MKTTLLITGAAVIFLTFACCMNDKLISAVCGGVFGLLAWTIYRYEHPEQDWR